MILCVALFFYVPDIPTEIVSKILVFRAFSHGQDLDLALFRRGLQIHAPHANGTFFTGLWNEKLVDSFRTNFSFLFYLPRDLIFFTKKLPLIRQVSDIIESTRNFKKCSGKTN